MQQGAPPQVKPPGVARLCAGGWGDAMTFALLQGLASRIDSKAADVE